jgi:hypothetical protein
MNCVFLQKNSCFDIFTLLNKRKNARQYLYSWVEQFAGVAELVDAQDLKSCGNLFPCRFESGPRYNYIANSGF